MGDILFEYGTIIDPTRHVVAVIEKPGVDDHDTVGHEIAAARRALACLIGQTPCPPPG